MTHATGVPCWMDLLTSDTARAREFYGRVFGWTAEEASPEFGGYFMFTVGGMPVAGCMPVQPGMDLGDVWGVYLTSADAAGTLAAAVGLGATTRSEPSPVADLGIQALLDDPSGARVGIWQPGVFAASGPSAPAGQGRPRGSNCTPRTTRVRWLLPRRLRLDAAGHERDGRLPAHRDHGR